MSLTISFSLAQQLGEEEYKNFVLKNENKRLQEENKRLQEKIEKYHRAKKYRRISRTPTRDEQMKTFLDAIHSRYEKLCKIKKAGGDVSKFLIDNPLPPFPRRK